MHCMHSSLMVTEWRWRVLMRFAQPFSALGIGAGPHRRQEKLFGLAASIHRSGTMFRLILVPELATIQELSDRWNLGRI
jgi:hypothetical protein